MDSVGGSKWRLGLIKSNGGFLREVIHITILTPKYE